MHHRFISSRELDIEFIWVSTNDLCFPSTVAQRATLVRTRLDAKFWQFSRTINSMARSFSVKSADTACCREHRTVRSRRSRRNFVSVQHRQWTIGVYRLQWILCFRGHFQTLVRFRRRSKIGKGPLPRHRAMQKFRIARFKERWVKSSFPRVVCCLLSLILFSMTSILLHQRFLRHIFNCSS